MPPEFIGQARSFLRDLPQKVAGIAVVGDLALDRFVFGSVDRISPEAPVPVLFTERVEEELGCAANLLRSLTVFTRDWPGPELSVFGVTGADENGAKLEARLGELPRKVRSHVKRDPSRPTTLKTRFIAGSQHQMIRVDHEDTRPVDASFENALLADLKAVLPRAPFVILEDYSKGLFTESFARATISAAKAAGAKVLVDPHRSTPATHFRGAWLMKPNVAEAEILLGTDLQRGADSERVAEAARAIQTRFEVANVIISRSRYGSTLVDEHGGVHHFPAIARAVFDVTGAGDTYLAVLAASLAANAPLTVACTLANAAASVVVAKVGTASATADEVLTELLTQPGNG